MLRSCSSALQLTVREGKGTAVNKKTMATGAVTLPYAAYKKTMATGAVTLPYAADKKTMATGAVTLPYAADKKTMATGAVTLPYAADKKTMAAGAVTLPYGKEEHSCLQDTGNRSSNTAKLALLRDIRERWSEGVGIIIGFRSTSLLQNSTI